MKRRVARRLGIAPRRVVYALLGIGVLGVAGFMISQALNTALVYFILPNEYAQQPDQFENRRIRLGGLVAPESVAFNDQDLQLTFLVTDGIQSYRVEHVGAPPELFRENAGVVIEGSFDADVFVSDNLLIKHSEVYEAPEDGHIDIEELRRSLQ
ncbi:MAG: cytochrome c maturation protein CcmE [Trueperaceae bacterium]|nr:MAG: cytochrome c maturation protein CcmE [Trueperaceae bacterium]